MKAANYSKRVLFLALTIISLNLLKAQQAIPNGNFEEWNTQEILTPTGYVNSSIERPENYTLGTCERVSDPQNGSFAIRLTTKKLPNENDRMPGYFANLPENNNGDPSTWHGGMPINEKPTGINGYFKHDVKTGDSAFILVVFSKNGSNIGSYFYFIGGQQTSYKEFNFTFNPALAQTPDSMIFGAVSSNLFNDIAIEGSMLQLDNITLTGVVNQPPQLNGNFENWTTVEIEAPKNWYVESQNRTQSIKTTTKYKGNYGVKLESYLSIDGSSSKIQDSYISTGYYTQTSNEGGFPFSNLTDTLYFWYKYTTAGDSKATMSITYKKGGNIIGGRRLELEPWNTDFKKVAYLIEDNGQTPDTLIVSFASLRSDIDKYNLANAGSKLYLDEVQLASQKLNTGMRGLKQNNLIGVYPNPASESINISLPANVSLEGVSMVIINQIGQEVKTLKIEQAETQLSLHGLKPGLYNYIISNKDNAIQKNRLLIQ